MRKGGIQLPSMMESPRSGTLPPAEKIAGGEARSKSSPITEPLVQPEMERGASSGSRSPQLRSKTTMKTRELMMNLSQCAPPSRKLCLTTACTPLLLRPSSSRPEMPATLGALRSHLHAACCNHDRARHEGEGGKPWHLVVTGHSLGAGVAALVALKLKERYPSLYCWSFAAPGRWRCSPLASLPFSRDQADSTRAAAQLNAIVFSCSPGALLSGEIAESMTEYCTSVVVGKARPLGRPPSTLLSS